MTPSIRSASRGSARSALSASRRQLRTRSTTRLESACATYRLRSISYDCSRQEGSMVRDHEPGEAVLSEPSGAGAADGACSGVDPSTGIAAVGGFVVQGFQERRGWPKAWSGNV